MIADTLNFLRRHLDERLRVELGGSQDDATGDRVVFIDGDKLEPISFQLNAVTVLLINVDHFRAINLKHGYECGDAVLKLIAERLKQCTRASDTSVVCCPHAT